MSIFDNLISKFAPHICLGCGYEGSIICVQCLPNFGKMPSCCYKCRRLTADARTCESCRATSGLYRVNVATAYEDLAKQVVWRLKFDGAQAAATTMASLMAPLVSQASGVWLVPVPTATTRARGRGYDQAKLLAKAISRGTRLRYVDCLRRQGQAHQVGSSRHQRLQQMKDAFSVKSHTSPVGNKILLVDDVVTTGATLEAAAAVLKQAGAAEISALAFAQPK